MHYFLQNYSNYKHPNIKFTYEYECNSKLSFLDCSVLLKSNKFETIITITTMTSQVILMMFQSIFSHFLILGQQSEKSKSELNSIFRKYFQEIKVFSKLVDKGTIGFLFRIKISYLLNYVRHSYITHILLRISI